MDDMPLRAAFDIYKARVSILKKGYEQEKYRIEQISRSFLGDLIVRAVTSVDIATYRDQRLDTVNSRTGKNISPSTVRLEMSLLSNFFDIARIEFGISDANPVSNVRKPKSPPGRDRLLTPREERLIHRYAYAHSNPEFYSIIVLALETAMRQGEILGLKWEHINLRTGIAHLPETKNGTKRDVPLSLKARDALIRLEPKSCGRVFGYTSNGLKSTWRFMLQKLNIEDLHFHDQRHHCITRIFQLGTLNIMEVAAISGHKSLAMLKRYTHLDAHRLVRKLEGNKHKGKQEVLNHLIPYPATVENQGDNIRVRLLDFDNLTGHGVCEDSAIRVAQDVLLRHILKLMRESQRIPQPDQYLELINEHQIVMIDPLGESRELA
jgi:integrase